MAMAFLLAFLLLAAPLTAETYEFDLDFDPATSTVSGSEIIVYSPAEVKDGAFLLLYPNLRSTPNPALNGVIQDALYADGFSPSWTRIESIMDGSGRPVPFTVVESALAAKMANYPVPDFLLRLDLPPAAGEQDAPLRLVVRFATRLPSILQGDETGIGGGFLQRFLWFPKLYPHGDAFILDAVEFTLRIRVPKGYRAVTGVAESGDEGAFLSSSDGVPRRGIPLAVMRRDRLEEIDLEAGGYSLRVLHAPGHGSQARRILTWAGEGLARYGAALGHLEDRRVTILEGPAGGLWGMAADGFILLGAGCFTTDILLPGFLDPLMDYLVSHEAAHLWTGIGTGTEFLERNWLSESLTQYVAIRWMEEKYGRTENLYATGPDVLAMALRSFLPFNSQADSLFHGFLGLRRDGFDYPLAAPVREQNLNGQSAVLYDKGAIAVRQMAEETGREAFDAALQAYLSRYRHRTGGTEEFLSFLEKARPGAAAAARRILNGGPYPDFEVAEVAHTAQGTRVRFTDRGKSGLSAAAVVETETERRDLMVNGDTEITVPGTAVRAAVDPDRWTLDVDRKNNFWPKKLSFFSYGHSPFEADAVTTTAALVSAAADASGNLTARVETGLAFVSRGMTDIRIETGLIPVLSTGFDGTAPLPDVYGRILLGLPGSLTLRAEAAVRSAPGWDAQVGLEWTAYVNRDIGRPQAFRAPELAVSASVGIDRDLILTPAARVDFLGIYAPLPMLAEASITGRLVLPGLERTASQAAVAQAGVSPILRLAPRLWLVPSLAAAISFPFDAALRPASGLRIGRYAGTAVTGQGRATYGLDLFFPIVNGLQIHGANLMILRGVFACLFAEGESSAAFPPTAGSILAGGADIHAGLELGLRIGTLMDRTVPLAVGLDLPVSRMIGEAAAHPASWEPSWGFYVSTRTVPLLYGLLAAY